VQQKKEFFLSDAGRQQFRDRSILGETQLIAMIR
jgi:hypothetical protein